MKIINVLKDDSFDEILELFRKAPEGEVFLVLPRNGRLFRHEDHFAAFASEASQGKKTVSVLTPNPDTAVLAKKFGFTVIASQKPNRPASVAPARQPAVLASSPPPADPEIRDEQDDAFSEVPMTSDATMGNDSIDSDAIDGDPLRNMHVLDEEGNPVDDNKDGKADEPDAEDVSTAMLASVVDGIRGGVPQRTLSPSSRVEKAAPIPVQTARELDYIDTVWRDKVGYGRRTTLNVTPSRPSLMTRFFHMLAGSFSLTARSAGDASVPKKVIAGILLAAFLVLGSVVYATTGSARVALAPTGKTLDTQITVQASDAFTSVDDAFYKIPGQLLEVSKTASNTVPATGNREVASKARGKLTVVNEYSSSPQTLVVTTRFQSSNGLVFRTLQNVTVPGSTVNAGKTVAGTTTVDVIADKPGPTYNVPAGNFTIMAFVEKGETDKVKQFYGRSDQPMTGGVSGPSSVVTAVDLENATAAASAAVKEEIKQALEAQGDELMVLDGDKPVMKDAQSSARVDDAADSVTATATGTLATVAFRSTDLRELIRKSFLKRERLMVMPDKLELSYSDISFKADSGTLTFTVTVKGMGYAPVDTDAIKQDIGGKNTANIQSYFKDKEGIRSATVTLSPFWVRSVPSNPAKIEIELVYDEGGQ